MQKDPQSQIEMVLSKKEKLYWVSKPPTGIRFRAIDWVLIPFSMLWGGFAIFWTFMATSMGGAFGLFGIPFVIVGLFLMFGRFIADSRYRAGMVYALSDRRVIILSGLRKKTVQSFWLDNLPHLDFRFKADGSGDILLGKKHSALSKMSSTESNPWLPSRHSDSLEGIENVKLVYESILKLRDKALLSQGDSDEVINPGLADFDVKNLLS
jgi:hypothetical protein